MKSCPSNPTACRRGAWGSVLATALLAVAGLALLGWWSAGAWAVPADDRFAGFALAAVSLALLLALPATAGRADGPALFRWAIVIDLAGAALVTAGAVSDAADWLVGLKLYAVLACFAVLQLGVARIARRIGASPGLATSAGVLLAVVAGSTLLWGHLLNRPFKPTSAGDRATLAVIRYANPLLATNDAINPPTRIDWPHHGQMYRRYGIIGESRHWSLPSWPIASAIYLAAGAALLLACWLWRPVRPASADCGPDTAGPSAGPAS